MARYRFWQEGWEHEAREVEVDDDVECVACNVTRPPSSMVEVDDLDPVVCSWHPPGKPDEIESRFMEVVELAPGLRGYFCREATRSEIASAKKRGEDVRAGRMCEVGLKPS